MPQGLGNTKRNVNHMNPVNQRESQEPTEGKHLFDAVISSSFEVANTLGKGFLEVVFQKALMRELEVRVHRVTGEQRFPLTYKGADCDYYFADLIVDGQEIVELKCARTIEEAHVAQCINYLAASKLRLGIVLNFGPSGEKFRKLRNSAGVVAANLLQDLR